LGWPEGTFLRAYDENQAAANELALETSCITGPLFTLLGKGPFEGTADTLLRTLAKCADEATTKQSGWPRSPRGLSESLRRLAPNLRAVGVDLRFWKLPTRERTRVISIDFSASEPSAPSEEAPADAGAHSCDPAELQAENGRTQRFDEARDELRDIVHRAKRRNDLKSAVAAVREWVRIEELERKGCGDLEEQSAWSSALTPARGPSTGNTAGQPLTETDKQALAEIEKFSPADRMAMREGFKTAVTLSKLARRPPEPDR
jgi:hypothetical protein